MKGLRNINLSNANTTNVTDMSQMFDGCSSLISLDLSSFDTSNVTDMFCMFRGCSSLKTIYVGNWNGYGLSMFTGCTSLVGGKGTKIGYNLYGYDNYGNPLYYYCDEDGYYANIDGGKDRPGLFTAKK